MPLFYVQGYIEFYQFFNFQVFFLFQFLLLTNHITLFRDKFEELQNKLDFTLREKTSQIGQAIKHISYGGLHITKRKRTANLFTHS